MLDIPLTTGEIRGQAFPGRQRATSPGTDDRHHVLIDTLRASALVWSSFLRRMPQNHTTLLDARAMDRMLRRMADEIVELNNGTEGLLIVGIQRRGVQLASRIVASIKEREHVDVPSGALDITLYRDDLQTVGPRPVVGPTDLRWPVDDQHVVIVDDVLYTGRTIRAALDELADFGRPRRIGLAVLIDRGGRELPIQPDVVGKTLEISAGQRIDVLVSELDDRDAVILAGTA